MLITGWLHGGELDSVGVVLDPSHDRRFDNHGRALAGDLQDEVVLFADSEGHIAAHLTAAEREVDEHPFAFCVQIELDGND